MMLTAQFTVVEQNEANPNRLSGRVALFNPDGTPYVPGEGPESNIPEPPAEGTYALHVIDGEYTWVEVEGVSGEFVIDTDTFSFENGILVSVAPV